MMKDMHQRLGFVKHKSRNKDEGTSFLRVTTKLGMSPRLDLF